MLEGSVGRWCCEVVLKYGVGGGVGRRCWKEVLEVGVEKVCW